MSEAGSNFDSGVFQLTDTSSTDENYVDKTLSTMSSTASPVKFRTNFLGNLSNFFNSAFATSTKNVSESYKTNGDVLTGNSDCSKNQSESSKTLSETSTQIEKDCVAVEKTASWENGELGEK